MNYTLKLILGLIFCIGLCIYNYRDDKKQNTSNGSFIAKGLSLRIYIFAGGLGIVLLIGIILELLK